jgi:hypothetical protein
MQQLLAAGLILFVFVFISLSGLAAKVMHSGTESDGMKGFKIIPT